MSLSEQIHQEIADLIMERTGAHIMVVEDEAVRTIEFNGTSFRYSPEFLAAFTTPEINYLVCFATKRFSDNAKAKGGPGDSLWEVALDYHTSSKLHRLITERRIDFEMQPPPHVYYSAKYDGLTVRQIHNDLVALNRSDWGPTLL